ncbi:MarR family winged helix-turn-helix transcriptional regulator [Desulfobacter latus]|uniref:Winged helix-turn-helix transcriptional regulator n=1 Tax=Desulfobacter latus TaxID=2292 RepID=A0A850SXX1_9BACT|nr:MarR family winged helix-turn-helix transcriptional regulator [Desulfobacter latus]NWH06164.1 winged helix-turn-helix transcriptional regulator [Desulfobacter latus]
MESLKNSGNGSDSVLAALRKIMRSIDLHSKSLVKRFGLTSPQLIVLREVDAHGQVTAGEIAHAVSLSQATITGIFERLEKRGLITRKRSSDDRRRILVQPTLEATKCLAGAPPLMQESFVDAFEKLQDWEKSMILSSLQRLVSLMDAQNIDAAPFLAAESLETPINGEN